MIRGKLNATLFAPLALIAGVAAILAACALDRGAPPPPQQQAKLTSGHLSELQLKELAAGADPRTLGLAEAGPINALPSAPSAAQAEAANAKLPFAGLPIEPMRPFVLNTDATDQARAVHCLAQAVYYEAAREPLKGQEAVAQVVLNRVRHPAYPKSVCGVVYQGASLSTGCQFTFTCDGSLRRAPEPAFWDRAVFVARQALGGFVDKDVGSATHYHAAYVAPYWAPTMVKMTQIGQHIFYRWSGNWGEPDAFTGRYTGHEAELTRAVLQSGDVRVPAEDAPAAQPPERKVTLSVASGDARTYQVANPGETSGDPAAEAGVLHASRRIPTRDQIEAVNAKIAAIEAGQAGAPSAAQAGQPASATTSGD